MTHSEGIAWISWFCKQRGNEFFCEIDKDYIQDKFNLSFLDSDVSNYKRAIETILDLDNEGESDALPEAEIEQCAVKLYGLIHARFILTNRGVELMMTKYMKGAFGCCPRVFCQRQAVLPIGLSDTPGDDTVRVYCPKCNDVYNPRTARHASLDGAFFGTGFPHMFFMVNPDMRPKRSKQKFIPRLYGFKIHNMAYCPEAQTVYKDQQREVVESA